MFPYIYVYVVFIHKQVTNFFHHVYIYLYLKNYIVKIRTITPWSKHMAQSPKGGLIQFFFKKPIHGNCAIYFYPQDPCMVYLPTFTIKNNQPWLQWILWILWVTSSKLHGNYYPIVPKFCQLPEGLKTLYDPCARATSREKKWLLWMARNKWVTEVIALLIRFIGAPFIIGAHLVWKGEQDLTAAL